MKKNGVLLMVIVLVMGSLSMPVEAKNKVDINYVALVIPSLQV